MMPQIRDALVTDAAAIATLLRALDYPQTQLFVARKLAQLLDDPNARQLVAVVDGAVVGFISLHFIPQLARAGDFCRISYFCVAASARGKGVGAALEARTDALARAHGCDRIELHCHSRRESAHRFYARQGYVESPKYFKKSLR